MNIARHRMLRLKTLRGMTVVHVGAHLAQEAERYESVCARRVLWVEAAPDTYEKLQQTLSRRDPNRRSALQKALFLPPTEHIAINALAGAKDQGEAEFVRFNNHGASDSIFQLSSQCKEMIPGLHATGEVLRLPFRKLDSIVRDAGIEPSEVNCLVLDVQGAELLVLQGATEILQNIQCLETELSTKPIYEGGVLFDELNAFLEQKQFHCKTRIRKVHQNAIYEAAA
ncbi:FkbM family methyltransferase [Neorhodopirellula pilleata]|uniref:Methyltransferase FkbM domain-containing protein n=1 Tax=Neorhodopirellula pilleata TaxID=2714738 RepID=A0A5C6A6V6_9BACT|nr:FkbM family methyltransferase [Neorhodopirellula pilleata]TWT95624.1 hypothetical protein Pla100_32650 [Neorhodopirellula pilleata]